MIDQLYNARISWSWRQPNRWYFLTLWLGTLQELKVLILQSNKFYSVIQEPEKTLSFSSCMSSIALITDLLVSSHQSTSIVGMIWKFDESQLAYMQPALLTREILAVLPTTGQYPQRHHSLRQYVRRRDSSIHCQFRRVSLSRSF